MRDLIDCCPDADSWCGEDKQKAEAIGLDVFVGNNLIARCETDSAANDYAEGWNE